MALALDFLTTLKDGLNNKDSSQCGNIMADDWQFVASGTIARGIPRDKPNTLDWISGGGNQIIIDNFEILYENDEVAVGTHTAIRGESFGNPNGIVMFCGSKRGDKFSYRPADLLQQQNTLLLEGQAQSDSSSGPGDYCHLY